MEDLIPIINKLQDVFALVGGKAASIDLPQIVVVGGQSSGKSSVLENIVGRDFLPRGQGIVTRRPLILQLVHIPATKSEKIGENDQKDEWGYGEFLHLTGQKFYDFEEVRKEIEKETDRTTGKNKGVSEQPIRLRIYSPHVVSLTLVDLPGITKVPVGDQPPDIEAQIVQMINSFITNPHSIILAVSPANVDLANSDAIKIAKLVDPQGVRTIGVITKLDIMDLETNALDTLMGRVIPLRLGFVGVVNRSQKDINEKKDIAKSLQDEEKFFETSSVYRSIASKMGTKFLRHKLNHLLLSHIRECLPGIRSRVIQNLGDVKKELAEFGDPILPNQSNKGALLLQLLTRYASSFCDVIDGKSKELTTTELFGGARINFIFNDVFQQEISSINPMQSLTINDIRTAIRNATGTRQTLFVPEVSFELLAKQQIARLEEPAIHCCSLVYDELVRIASQSLPKEMKRFMNLRERAVDVIAKRLTVALEPTKQMVSNLVQIELAHINTSHPDFIGGSRAVAQLMQKRTEKTNVPLKQEELLKDPKQGGDVKSSGSTVNPGSTTQSTPASTSSSSGNSNKNDDNSSGGYLFSLWGNSSSQSTTKRPQTSSNTNNNNNNNNNNNPVSVAPQTNLLPAQLRTQSAQLTDHERIVTEVIMTLLQSYFAIVTKNIQDSVPKAIMHFLVNDVKENIQHELVADLYKEDMLDELLEEADQVAQRRQQCVESMSLLKTALDVLNEVKEQSYK